MSNESDARTSKLPRLLTKHFYSTHTFSLELTNQKTEENKHRKSSTTVYTRYLFELEATRRGRSYYGINNASTDTGKATEKESVEVAT